eukprot:augustus_masked-scaffold_7-processed-gene-14.50-mRNA-1 protein AED:0.27 eAED:0.28 QI:0/-1/0/1/-1/1/1/0/521
MLQNSRIILLRKIPRFPIQSFHLGAHNDNEKSGSPFEKALQNFVHDDNYITSNVAISKTAEDEQFNQVAKKLTFLGLLADTGLCGIKIFAGKLSGSAALVSDGVHSASDMAAGFVTLAAIGLARKPADKKYPYSYGHFESLGSLGVSAMLLLGGLGSLHYSFSSLGEFMHLGLPDLMSTFSLGEPHGHQHSHLGTSMYEHFWLGVSVCCGSILSKEFLFRRTMKEGKKQNSPALVANAWHHRSDSWTSVAALGAILTSAVAPGLILVDPILGGVVSIVILKSAYEIGYDAVCDLTARQRKRDIVMAKNIGKIGEALRVKTNGEIQNLHNIRCRRVGPFVMVDLHVVVDSRLSVTAAYQATNKVRQAIQVLVPSVKQVFTHLQAHPSKAQLGEHILEVGNENEPSYASKGRIISDKELSLLRTRSQHEIELDLKTCVQHFRSSAIKNASKILDVSHISLHYDVSQVDTASGYRSFKLIAEVNLVMDDELTLHEAKIVAKEVKEEILRIEDVDEVDLHLEVLP